MSGALKSTCCGGEMSPPATCRIHEGVGDITRHSPDYSAVALSANCHMASRRLAWPSVCPPQRCRFPHSFSRNPCFRWSTHSSIRLRSSSAKETLWNLHHLSRHGRSTLEGYRLIYINKRKITIAINPLTNHSQAFIEILMKAIKTNTPTLLERICNDIRRWCD